MYTSTRQFEFKSRICLHRCWFFYFHFWLIQIQNQNCPPSKLVFSDFHSPGTTRIDVYGGYATDLCLRFSSHFQISTFKQAIFLHVKITKKILNMSIYYSSGLQIAVID